MNSIEELKEKWVDEFEPKTLDDMVLSDELRERFKNILNSKTKFSSLFVGTPGIGKSTLCNIIARELNASVCYIPCSMEGTVAVAQGKLKNFCDALDIEGRPKVIILDELDSASGTQDNSFQKNLRNIVNDAKDCIWLANCNYAEKVIDPIKSRFGTIELKFKGKDLIQRILYILKQKNVKYTTESVRSFVDVVMKKCYPDVRRIISFLQDMCSTGELIVTKDSYGTNNVNFVVELLDMCRKERDILKLRQFYISNKTKIDDYLTFSSNLFNEGMLKGIINDKDLILKIGNIIYQMNLVIDKEISFFQLITLLNKYLCND